MKRVRGVIAASTAVGVEVEVVLLTSATTGHASGLRDRLEGRNERVRRDDHLVSGLDRGREQAEPKRIEPAREPDALTAPAVGGERGLERANLRTVRERARVDELGDLRKQLVSERAERRSRIEEGDRNQGRHRRRARHDHSVESPRRRVYRPTVSVSIPKACAYGQLRLAAQWEILFNLAAIVSTCA